MEPNIYPIEKENHLNQTSIFGFQPLIFRGVFQKSVEIYMILTLNLTSKRISNYNCPPGATPRWYSSFDLWQRHTDGGQHADMYGVGEVFLTRTLDSFYLHEMYLFLLATLPDQIGNDKELLT